MNSHLIEQYRSCIETIDECVSMVPLPATLLKLRHECEDAIARLERETVIRWEEAEHVAA